VRIHKHDHRGARKVSYDGALLSRDDRQLTLRAEWRFPTQVLPYTTLTAGDVFIETFYLDRWHNVFEIRDSAGALKGWYANVTRPTLVADNDLIWEDLALDVWMSPDGTAQVLDEDEFAEEARGMSASDRASAAGAVVTAIADLRDRWRTYAVECATAGLGAHGWRLATAESCTGGLLASVITDTPGVSRVYLGGVVAYDNAVKRDALGVLDSTLSTVGAVSEATARQMARGVCAAQGAEVGLSTTGIAGPDGGSVEKPVGLVYIGLHTPAGDCVERHVWPYDRSGNKHASVDQALRMLLAALHER
jgi:PncC family amidohydrolase